MSKKKKSGASIQTIKNQDLKLQERFIERIKFISDALAGPEYFKMFPKAALHQLYKTRYPVLKAKAKPGSDIPKHSVVQYNKLMNKFMLDMSFTTDKGVEIPLRWYLCEGLLLVNFIATAPGGSFSNAVELKKAFADYLPGSDFDDHIDAMMMCLIRDTNIFLSEMDKNVIRANIDSTACRDPFTTSNAIYIQFCKTEKTTVTYNHVKRKIIRVGWIDCNEIWDWTKVKPSMLGYSGTDAEVLTDVYIQQHGINQLQERLDITPGILHYIVSAIFTQDEIPHLKRDNYSLVELELAGQKAGYLVVKWHDHKLVIHTFLFLTNDGTPEGQMLGKLLSIELADKKYLIIDNLPTFNSYHIEKNERLSSLFIEAGCGSILKLGHTEMYSANVVKDKDPESILRYISDASLLKGQDRSN